MEISQEQVDRLKQILEFYSEGNNYEWEGCHCHGKFVQVENGDMADDGIEILREISRCPKCHHDLEGDYCSNMDCEDYDWSKE